MLGVFRALGRSRGDLLRRGRPRGGPGPLRPDWPLYLVGDIHGRLDLLDDLLRRIDRHCGMCRLTAPHLIFLGDYIDRGPDSAGVLARLMRLQADLPGHVHCLMGDHERLMLDFLDHPRRDGPAWLAQGGGATLRSYGLPMLPYTTPPSVLEDVAFELSLALALTHDGVEEWLRALPLILRSGNLVMTHAGADPSRPIEGQRPKVVLQGHPAFDRLARRDRYWIAHGHRPTSQVQISEHRIALDTGAFRTGRLSALAIGTDGSQKILMTSGRSAQV